MSRLTTRNSEGIPVFKHPYQCERCNEPIWRLPDTGDGSPTDRLLEYEEKEYAKSEETSGSKTVECKGLPKGKLLQLIDSCVSGSIIYTEDLMNILNIYGDTFVKEEGSIFWDLKKDIFSKELSLSDALEHARQGCFVASVTFGEDQSLHYYNGRFYYEDGPEVTIEFLETQDWAQELPWKVIAVSSQVDSENLNRLHHLRANYGFFNNIDSYMTCIKRNK